MANYRKFYQWRMEDTDGSIITEEAAASGRLKAGEYCAEPLDIHSEESDLLEMGAVVLSKWAANKGKPQILGDHYRLWLYVFVQEDWGEDPIDEDYAEVDLETFTLPEDFMYGRRIPQKYHAQLKRAIKKLVTA